MKIKFRERRFQLESVRLIVRSNAIVEEYDAMGIRITLRQLYYQLVARGIIANVMKEYDRLVSVITDARYAGLIDWNAIEDNLRKPRIPSTFANLDEIVAAAIASYRLDYWEGMPDYVELYTEKDALSSILAPIANDRRIAFQVNRGYASASSMFEAFSRFSAKADAGKNCFILYLGDHDPSGIDMIRDIEDRLNEFGVVVEIEHIALTERQIKKFNPPPNPAKMKDSRAAGYVARHGASCWEVDALPPDAMIRIVEAAIDAHLDEDERDRVLKIEAADKAKLAKLTGRKGR
jgi:hypothetical protein